MFHTVHYKNFPVIFIHCLITCGKRKRETFRIILRSSTAKVEETFLASKQCITTSFLRPPKFNKGMAFTQFEWQTFWNLTPHSFINIFKWHPGLVFGKSILLMSYISVWKPAICQVAGNIIQNTPEDREKVSNVPGPESSCKHPGNPAPRKNIIYIKNNLKTRQLCRLPKLRVFAAKFVGNILNSSPNKNGEVG